MPEWLPRKSPNVPVACVAKSVAICSTLQTIDGTIRVVGGSPYSLESVPYSLGAKAADGSHFQKLRIERE